MSYETDERDRALAEVARLKRRVANLRAALRYVAEHCEPMPMVTGALEADTRAARRGRKS